MRGRDSPTPLREVSDDVAVVSSDTDSGDDLPATSDDPFTVVGLSSYLHPSHPPTSPSPPPLSSFPFPPLSPPRPPRPTLSSSTATTSASSSTPLTTALLLHPPTQTLSPITGDESRQGEAGGGGGAEEAEEADEESGAKWSWEELQHERYGASYPQWSPRLRRRGVGVRQWGMTGERRRRGRRREVEVEEEEEEGQRWQNWTRARTGTGEEEVVEPHLTPPPPLITAEAVDDLPPANTNCPYPSCPLLQLPPAPPFNTPHYYEVTSPHTRGHTGQTCIHHTHCSSGGAVSTTSRLPVCVLTPVLCVCVCPSAAFV